MEIQRPRLSSTDLRDSLVSTLRGLCSKEPSVTFVCRETGINRQQFAKYLDGRSMPSFENAMRIADYFDITCEELFGFRTVSHVAGFEFPLVVDKTSLAFKAKRAIEKVEQKPERDGGFKSGYYFCYVGAPNASTDPKDGFNRSIIRIEQNGNASSGSERVGNEIVIERRQYFQDQLGVRSRRAKQYGVGQVTQDLLSIRYCDGAENDCLKFMIVRPHRLSGHDLSGVLLRSGGQGDCGVTPLKVFMQYLDERPNLRQVIGDCGRWPYGQGYASGEIEQVLRAIS